MKNVVIRGQIRSPRAFALGLFLVLGLTLTLIGLRTGMTVQDEDEAIYVRTLHSMQAGAGYYPAMQEALTAKEGAPPASVRAIRPPTIFLFLRWFPESTWRLLAGGVFAVTLALVWLLARRDGDVAGIWASLLAFAWLSPASPYLFLHAELWGLPFFLAGLYKLRQGRDGPAAAFMVDATLTRELFGLGLIFALLTRRRRAWIYGALVSAAAAAVHVLFAQGILSATGHDAPLRNAPYNAAFLLKAIGPGTSIVSGIFGAAVLLFAIVALVRRYTSDPAAAVLFPFAIAVGVAGLVATRLYWNLTWGPALAAFAPAGVAMVARALRRRPKPAGSIDLRDDVVSRTLTGARRG